jgi:diguanylate cyclase
VHERERHRLELQQAATHDALTGLLNRGAAMDAIARDLARSQRDETPMMILFIDLDAFKSINDTYGHHVGDAALRQTAEALRAATRQSDIVARLGGDEFLVAGVASGAEEMEVIARRVHDSISSRSVSNNGRRIAIDNSIGIASIQPGDTADSIVRNADEALYRAKRRGRNQVAWNRPDLSQTSR